MKEIWELYVTFMRIGGLTFGGGLAMLPMLKFELVEKKKWITEEELLDYYAIGQCTPGIIAVNTATFVGNERKGMIGGICATLGMVTPSLVIVSIIAMFLSEFMDSAILNHALMGIRAVVCALMLHTIITLTKKAVVNIASGMIMTCSCILVYFIDFPTIAIVVLAGMVGVILKSLEDKKK